MNKRWTLALILLAVASMSGCGARRAPLYLDSAFEAAPVHTIALFPVVDRRSDRSVQLDSERDLRAPAEEILRKKGYQVILSEPRAEDADEAMLDDALLPSLVPSGADALAVVYLDDLRKEYSWRIIWLTYLFEVEAAAKIVTRERGVLWYDKTSYARRDAGLVTAPLAQAFSAAEGYGPCLRDLFSTFPDH
jgi:predicted small lipoprotein YifL